MYYDRCKFQFWAVLIACGLSFLVVTPGHGEPRYDLHNDLIVPEAFEFAGVIDKMSTPYLDDGAQLIIDDKVYRLNKDTILRNRFGTLVGITSFRDGMSVGFFVVEDDLIIKMWQTVDERGQDSPVEILPQSVGQPAVGEDLRLEDGVWKN